MQKQISGCGCQKCPKPCKKCNNNHLGDHFLVQAKIEFDHKNVSKMWRVVYQYSGSASVVSVVCLPVSDVHHASNLTLITVLWWLNVEIKCCGCSYAIYTGLPYVMGFVYAYMSLLKTYRSY